METLIIHPDNKEQLAALKTFMKAFKISFESEKSTYNPEFVAKIQESREQVKNGETRVVNIADL
jgi:ribosomal protein S20